MKDRTKKTLALLCSPSGIVKEIVRDDFGLDARVSPGRPLVLLFDGDSYAKAARFMTMLADQGTAMGWELTVVVDDAPCSLHFCGGSAGGELLVIGAGTVSNASRLLDEMMRLSNEQTNALRASLKESALLKERTEHDSAMYDELSRLNNELANLQRQLSKQNAELARLNTLKSQFLGMAAHDLHHPLYVIQMYSEFIREEAAARLEPTHLEFLDIIQQSSETMRQMIADYLDITAIEAGKLVLETAVHDIAALICAGVRRQTVLAEAKGIALHLSTPDRAGVMVDCDPAKLDQIVSNLVSNAVKYSHTGTTVRVDLSAQGTEAVLAVTDQGPGIPAKMMTRLFEPFERLPIKPTKSEKSSGLGLAIVKKIVDGHGWRIHVASREGTGSTFSVNMPLAAGHEA